MKDKDNPNLESHRILDYVKEIDEKMGEGGSGELPEGYEFADEADIDSLFD